MNSDLVQRAHQLRVQALANIHDTGDGAVDAVKNLLDVWAEAVVCADRNTFLEIQAEIGALNLTLAQMGCEVRTSTPLLNVVTGLGDAILTRNPEWIVEEVWDLLETDVEIPRWKWVLDWLDHHPGVTKAGLCDRVHYRANAIRVPMSEAQVSQCVSKTLGILAQYGMVTNNDERYHLTSLGRKLAIRYTKWCRTTPVTPLEK